MIKTLEDMRNELKRLGLNPDTFCFAPYINADLDQSGSVYTCYRGRERVGNWKKQPFTKLFNNAYYKNIRNDLYCGQRNKNCVSCWNAEDSNSKSPRMDFFGDFERQVEDKDALIDFIKNNPDESRLTDLERIEIRPSNLCNLQCMHCGPGSSTLWVTSLTDKETFEIYEETSYDVGKEVDELDEPVTHDNISKLFKVALNSESRYKEDIKELLASASMIHFTGGEPLLTPEHIDWLEYMTSKNPQDQKLVYNTNLNVKDISKYLKYWMKFKQVEIVCSIDASFDTYDFFRMRGDIELVKSNLRRIKDFNLSNIILKGTVTFNMFSALRWTDILNNWLEYDLLFHTSLVLDNPVSSLELPDSIRQRCIYEMQDSIEKVKLSTNNKDFIDRWEYFTNDCLNYMKNNFNGQEKLSERSTKYIKLCERINNKKMLDYFPELEEYV